MTPAPNPPPALGPKPDYLCVEPFLTSMVAAQALKTAFALCLIDVLEHESVQVGRLAERLKIERRGLGFLLNLLALNNVVDLKSAGSDRVVELTSAFRQALRFRDLLEAKVDFANLVAPDVLDAAPISSPIQVNSSARHGFLSCSTMNAA